MQADYIIAGAGSAGCVLANRLTEDPNTRVILIEAGGRDLHPMIHIPAGYMKLLDRYPQIMPFDWEAGNLWTLWFQGCSLNSVSKATS